VADRLSEWPRGDGPRRAGVSSFGVGGTNAHVVLEEPPAPATTPSVRPCELLLLSARSRDALNQATTNLAEHLRGAGDVALADVAYTLALGRRGFRERRFVVASSHAEAIAQLSEPQRAATRSYDGGRANVAFLFPGQGAQAPNMGLGLYTVDPVFRAVVDDCAERLKPDLGRDLRELLFPADTQTDDAAEALRNTAFTQPALFVVEYAVAQVLLGWGIRPSAMIGHSIGEFVSAVLAGVLSLPDALSLVAARGRLMQDLPGGSMLSVRLPAADLERRLPKDLAIASDNGPSLCVVAGSTEAVAELQRALEAEGTVCRALLTSHAFHSPMMDPVVEPFAEMVGKVRLSAPQVPFVSTLTGTWITEEQACDPRYWAKHLRERVRFREAAAELLKDEHRVLLEVGPRATLTALARQQSKLRDRLVATPTLGDSGSVDGEWKALLAALGQLWSAGVEVDWSNLFADERRRRVPLPTYPFERKRYWLDPLPRSDRPAQALDGNLLPQPAPASNGAGTALPIEPIPTFPMSVPMPESAPAAAGRKDRLVAQLREVFEDISGLEMRDVDVHATFLELGLDSLSLTQVAQQLQKTFRVKITFRELMEAFPSLDRLGDHMDQQLPPDPQAPPAATAAPAAATAPITAAAPVAVAPAALVPAPIVAGPAGDLQRVIDQQLLLMQQQLQLLAGRSASAPAVSAPASVAVAQPQAPAPALQPAAPAAAAAPAAPSNGVDAASSETEYQRTYDVKKAFGAIARINTSGTDDLTPGQRARLDAFIQRYTARTRRSKEYTQEHRSRLSDPRAVTGFRPQLKELVYQIVIERSKGSHMWDLDGNEYIDTLSGFGCNLFGWQPDFVNEAVIRQIDIGHEIGPMTPLAAEVADLICDMTGAERAAFCNTGSEAVMGCMRIARTVTGRDTIAIFNGSYHGIFDEVIVRGTKKLRAVPAAPGILPSTAQNVLVLEYGSPEALEILRARGDELAAIMVEPVQSRRPDLQPRDFLHELRGIADRSGAVYIFDEVITGFRCHPGGAQAYFGVQADLASYGKVIGGGYPFAVIAGKRPYMDALDGGHWQYGDDSKPTVGVTYFAGTFCRHPLALAAAKAALLHLKEQGPRLQETLNAKTSALAAELNAHFEAVGAPLEIRHFASLWKVFWKQEQPYGDLLFYSLREKGIHILDLFPCFLTTAHSDADVAAIVQAFKDAVAELQAAEFLPGRSEPERILFDPKAPPVPGARLGRDRSGNPAWFVPHPQNPSKYVKVDAP
ncbi:MAG TPA: aminotransferase class III-fold pyridoxal phosphate-dependent enzyme, partial [Polyangiaceae bacterium]|nr:aminotransferase class III-fold pyridoxal phosphate-dependent enzyme [Polyangiaceae bacterium]